MHSDELPERLERYLKRQTAWVIEVLDFLEGLEAAFQAQDFDRIVSTQTRHHKQFEQLDMEYRALYKEWVKAEDISPESRDAVRAVSEQAQQYTRRLEAKYAQTLAVIDAKKVENRAALASLRQGHALLEKYRPGVNDLSNLLNKKA